MNYISIEQSKKLLELGLNPKSSDMYYFPVLGDAHRWVISLGSYFECIPKINFPNDNCIPCWSVGALLNIIPNYQLQTQTNHKIGILFGYKEGIKIIEADTVIDACFEMICWLLENGYIK